MRFHDSVIEELLRLYDIYGGHREEVKLRQVLEQLDMSTYQQKHPPHGSLVVLAKDLKK